ncbi:MAG: hypothetical protein KF741_08325 [Ferruginibacter sp.]|nr:hypothetical protein [Bacteroidota bacterium]MBX2919242.1 hypothetical protein [Ferruginibacter sp.]MCC7378149.1 hypothetical protein [Chitinophagaceae bacterium]
MERVETLLKKLLDQFSEKASPGQLLLTVQMLQAELQHLQAGNTSVVDNDAAVAVTISAMPANHTLAEPATQNKDEERIVEVLQVNEAEVEAELEEIKRNAEAIQKISVQNKPHIIFDTGDDIPTLTHQQKPFVKTIPATERKEINDTINENHHTSLNERLKQSKIDLGDTLTEAPIRDLKKAIGVNDRFLFINELFRGDEAVYERSIKTINNFSIFAEAEYWIQRELKVKNGWNDNDEMVKQFYQLVKRRFS